MLTALKVTVGYAGFEPATENLAANIKKSPSCSWDRGVSSVGLNVVLYEMIHRITGRPDKSGNFERRLNRPETITGYVAQQVRKFLNLKTLMCCSLL